MIRILQLQLSQIIEIDEGISTAEGCHEDNDAQAVERIDHLFLCVGQRSGQEVHIAPEEQHQTGCDAGHQKCQLQIF